MSPLNRGPLLGPRMPSIGMRPPLPRFGGRPPMPGMPPRMPPPPMGPMFGPMRQRMMLPRPGPMMRPGGPPPLFGPRGRGVPPLMPPMMGPRVMGPRGPIIRPGPRGIMPPQGLPHMRPRFPMGNGNVKLKPMSNAKKVIKLEELELKKPWMTDEIRNEIQKKNKLYAKAKKNKDAKEWEEFKDLRNKVTRMIRDAKNEYLAKNPEQAHKYEDDDEEPYDQRDENYTSSEEDIACPYCEVCDREFGTSELLQRHIDTHKTCDIDGCTFSAHPKLVEKHIKMQHCTGLYHRMKNLASPEDIEKWILERKKKYPTKINVERKEAEHTEKIERGEIIEKQNMARGGRKSVQEKRKRVRKRRIRDTKVEPEAETQLYRGLQPFGGTAQLRLMADENGDGCSLNDGETDGLVNLGTGCDISDEDDESNQARYTKVVCVLTEADSEPPAGPAEHRDQSGLANLIANYGSDSDEDDAPDEVPIKRLKTDIPMENELLESEKDANEPTKEKQTTRSTSRGEPDRCKNSKATKNIEKPTKTDESPRAQSTHNKHYSQKRLMLLQRLLSRSIQHERNLICQCIKYIADNNFFLK